MGIAGLHTLLKSIQKPCHLSKFKGQTLGVDAYVWLHTGIISCATQLALGQPTRKYVDFALGRLHMLQHFGIIPYVVFDGDNLPGKAATEEERAAKRASHRATGLALLDSGRTKDAHREFQGAVDVTPSMARAFIDELRRLDIKYVVAPYEADAQLVYLESQGMVDAILSEDSDLLVFGAKRLISKLDKHGDCIELSRADFGDCKDINMVGWTDAEFRAMCILSGCDYLKSMHRMGLKSAYTSLRKHKRVERVVQMWQFENRTVVPPGYLHEFRRADATFLYQRVFCPKAREVVTLHPTPADVDPGTLVLIGDHIEPAVAQGVASGDLHPMTKQALNPYPASPSRGPQGRQWQPARRSTLPAATSKGSMVPISRLFTPKRTPLATLDPNSLTPTDSQRDLLRGNAGRSWSANAVLPNRTMCPDSAPITPLNLRQALAVESDAVTGKRLRDVGAAPDEGDVGDDTPSKSHVDRTGRSRFFSNSRGPVRPVARQKRPKIDIWEDGPVAGNGHSLGGADTTVAGDQGGSRDGPVDTPRMNSGEQQEHAAECAVVTPTLAGGNVAAEASNSRQSPRQSGNPNEPDASVPLVAQSSERSAVEADCRSPDKDVLREHVVRMNLKLRERYAYTSPQQRQQQLHDEDETVRRRHSAGGGRRGISRVASESERTALTTRATPLQRLGRAALARSRSLGTPSRGSRVRPASIGGGLPAQSLDFTGRIGHTGSEDLLHPGNEEEEEEQQEEEGDQDEKGAEGGKRLESRRHTSASRVADCRHNSSRRVPPLDLRGYIYTAHKVQGS